MQAAIYGPMQARRSKNEIVDRAFIDVIVQPHIGQSGPAEKEYEKIIRETFKPVIITTKFPRSVIKIIVQVIHDDGSLLSTMTNAVQLALLDAGVELTAMVSSVSCAMVGSTLRLDPSRDAEEESKGRESCNICISLKGLTGNVLACVTEGLLSEEQYFICTDAAKRAAPSVLAFYRLTMEQHFKKDLARS